MFTLKKLARTLLYRFCRFPLLPPTLQEQQRIDKLRLAFGLDETGDQAEYSPSEQFWRSSMRRLRELVLQRDARAFLRWDVVMETMFVANAAYLADELAYLKSLDEWMHRWKPAITESAIGCPVPFFKYPRSSGNLLHHAYHLARFEQESGLRVEQMTQIFEFGGGYGSMCRLVHKLGFKGRYLIFDLPPFSALQTYYLESIGLKVHDNAALRDEMVSGVFCLSSSDYLKQIGQQSGGLFLATWSLSETPLHVRNGLEELISQSAGFLIGYQERFGEMNNERYFSGLRQGRQDLNWALHPIDWLPGNFYLFGWPNRPNAQ